jgi:mannosyltransferase
VRRWEAVGVIVILLAALALRLYHLDAQSLWNDEGTSVALAQRDLATIARHASYDIHPPLYYFLLHGWVALVGTSEVAVRSLSVVAGVALVAGVWALARRLVGPVAALAAAALAAAAPFQVYYSQEARMYIWAALFALLATLAFERWLRPPSARSATGQRAATAARYVLAAVATVYSHYLGATVLVAHNLAFIAWWAWRWRQRADGARGAAWRTLATWAALQGLIVLAYLPWLAVSWRSLRNWPAVSTDFAVLAMLGDALRVAVWGPAVAARRAVTAAALGVVALTVPGLVGMRRGAAPSAAPEGTLRGARPRWFGALLLALYLVVPIALMAVASLGRPMYKTKFVLLATPPLYVLVAAGAVSLGQWVGARVHRRGGRRALAAAVTGVALVGALAPAAQGLARLYWDTSTYRDDYRGIAAYIAATAGPNDAILINAPSQVETLGYYYQGPLPWYPLPRQRPIDADDARAALEAIAARHDTVYGVLWATNESDPERVIENWLDSHAFKAMDRWFGDVRLALWALPRATEGVPVHAAGHLLGDTVRLAGYSVLTPAPAGGDVLQVALHWEALAPMAERYKVFVHLVDTSGTIVAQRDSEPGGGARLTSDWAPGERITDLYGLLLPPGTPPGEHVLRVGMYALNGGERLPVTHDGAPLGDAIDLTSLHVRAGKGPG